MENHEKRFIGHQKSTNHPRLIVSGFRHCYRIVATHPPACALVVSKIIDDIPLPNK
jgi:hypothetical protein